jgi:hypothetical protein
VCSNGPRRFRGATNPGNIGHEWVRRRFLAKPDPERPFVSAKLVGNPSLDAADYREALAVLDETTRRQLEEGLWIRDANGLVYRFSEARNVIQKAPECQRYVLGIDYGARSPTAFVVVGWRYGDPTAYVLKAWKKADLSPSDAAIETRKLKEQYPFTRIIGDTGGLGAGYELEAQRRFKLPIEAAEKQGKLGYIKLLNGELERSRIKVVASECQPLITEWLELPWHEDREKEASGFDNHCADACLYAWRSTTSFSQPEAEYAEPISTPAALEKQAKERKAKYLRERERERERAQRYGAAPTTHTRQNRWRA